MHTVHTVCVDDNYYRSSSENRGPPVACIWHAGGKNIFYTFGKGRHVYMLQVVAGAALC